MRVELQISTTASDRIVPAYDITAPSSCMFTEPKVWQNVLVIHCFYRIHEHILDLKEEGWRFRGEGCIALQMGVRFTMYMHVYEMKTPDFGTCNSMWEMGVKFKCVVINFITLTYDQQLSQYWNNCPRGSLAGRHSNHLSASTKLIDGLDIAPVSS